MDNLDLLLDQLIETQTHHRDLALATFLRFGEEQLGIDALKATLVVEALLRYKQQGALNEPSESLPPIPKVPA